MTIAARPVMAMALATAPTRLRNRSLPLTHRKPSAAATSCQRANATRPTATTPSATTPPGRPAIVPTAPWASGAWSGTPNATCSASQATSRCTTP